MDKPSVPITWPMKSIYPGAELSQNLTVDKATASRETSAGNMFGEQTNPIGELINTGTHTVAVAPPRRRKQIRPWRAVHIDAVTAATTRPTSNLNGASSDGSSSATSQSPASPADAQGSFSHNTSALRMLAEHIVRLDFVDDATTGKKETGTQSGAITGDTLRTALEARDLVFRQRMRHRHELIMSRASTKTDTAISEANGDSPAIRGRRPRAVSRSPYVKPARVIKSPRVVTSTTAGSPPSPAPIATPVKRSFPAHKPQVMAQSSVKNARRSTDGSEYTGATMKVINTSSSSSSSSAPTMAILEPGSKPVPVEVLADGSIVPIKRKRGRPRKYLLPGTVVLEVNPAVSAPAGTSTSAKGSHSMSK